MIRLAALLSASLIWSLAVAKPAAGQPGRGRIEALLRRMTLDEKLSLVHGTRDPEELGEAGYWPGLARLGIPPLRFADGPPGVNVNREATAMPAPVGLAATFSPEAARLYAVVLGREARSLGQNVLLAPHINIVRDPLFRRNHTTFSEDPLLNARLSAAEIRGIQSQGIMAMAKHLVVYNGADNVEVDERTLHEFYLPAFEAAVKTGVAAVMCAYNRVNGPWACENAGIGRGILRDLWGFQGFVASDWGAVHSPLAIVKGTDLEMPGREIAGREGPYFGSGLPAAIESGVVPLQAIDAAVASILSQMDRFHLLGTKRAVRTDPIDVAADAAIARQIAVQGAVLLRNDGALPLTASDLQSLALIGPTAGQLASGFLGERAFGFESRLVSPLVALRKTASDARIAYSPGVDLTGVPIPTALLSGNGRPEPPGLPGATVDFQGRSAVASGADFSWQGTLAIPVEGDYTFLVQPVLEGGSEGGGTILIDGRVVARTGGPGFGGTGMKTRKWSSLIPTTDGRDNGRGSAHLTAGGHPIELRAASFGEGPLSIRYAWITPKARNDAIAAAAALARAARTAVVFAWSESGAGFSLPEDQDRLIAAVAAANPNTIVVLNIGGPVSMPWKESVRAILEMWYPGQEGGWATADILLGRANPGGKLPVTFPVRLEDSPVHAPQHAERLTRAQTATGSNALTVFSEGIAVGYRWYDQQRIEPLFPFGHGLSYTRFEYSDLAVTRGRRGVEIVFTIRNTGSRAGAEVPQVYVGAPEHPPVPMVPKSLAGFERVELKPGRSAKLRIAVPRRALSYWSTGSHGWIVAEGERPVLVGSSSRDIRLKGTIPAK